MSDYLYFPILKTRDAELRCFSNIRDDRFSKILPVYELTKSRKTTVAPDGDIHRRMLQIKEIQKDRPFVLDLCTDDKYINPQIEQLLSEAYGFKDWQYFIFDMYGALNIIPMIHIYEGDDGVSGNVSEFVKYASKKKSYLAVRLPYDLGKDNVSFYLNPIVESMTDGCKLYLFLDAGHIRETDTDVVVGSFIDSCLGSEGISEKIEDVVMLCTSFPASPAAEGNSDSNGKFPIYEENVYQGVVKDFPVKYGDYVSINTKQIEMKGGTFVPRIDIALLNGFDFFYKRHRRNQGGYALCAKEVVNDHACYVNLGVWADDEIASAARNKPSGISPSFWISVRMNYYVETRLRLREASPD